MLKTKLIKQNKKKKNKIIQDHKEKMQNYNQKKIIIKMTMQMEDILILSMLTKKQK